MKPVEKFLALPLGKKIAVLSFVLLLLLGAGLLFNGEFFEGLINAYGLPGLFLASAVGSTIFLVFSTESLLLILFNAKVDAAALVVVAAGGSFLGTCVNYWLGYFGSNLIEAEKDHAKMEKAKKVMDKYGWLGLFVVIAAPLPLPIPVDPITIIPGIARMNFLEFCLTVALGKIIRYTLWILIFVGIINGFH